MPSGETPLIIALTAYALYLGAAAGAASDGGVGTHCYELVAIDGAIYSHNRCIGEYEVVSGGKPKKSDSGKGEPSASSREGGTNTPHF